MIDFSKAFDRVNHPILFGKLTVLGHPDPAISWIYLFLTGHTQVVKCNDKVSQGSGIGPIYAVMENDLHMLSPKNIVVKYAADDTNVLVPADSGIDSFRNLTMLTSGWKTIKWSSISLKQKRSYSGDLTQGYTSALFPFLSYNRSPMLYYWALLCVTRYALLFI